MEGQDRHPVQPPAEPGGEEDRPLAVVTATRAVIGRGHLEPGEPWHLHFGAQSQEVSPFESLDSPEVEGLPYRER